MDAMTWMECPAEGMPALMIGTMTAECPYCDFLFTTMMDEPVTPRHWSSIGGEWIRVAAPSGCANEWIQRRRRADS